MLNFFVAFNNEMIQNVSVSADEHPQTKMFYAVSFLNAMKCSTFQDT